MDCPTEPQDKILRYSKVIEIFAAKESVFSWECVAPEEPPVHLQVPDEVIGGVDYEAKVEEG